MPFTRTQASELLNQSEMKLFDDSRANALRAFDRPALASRIVRTRAARDRARDLLKRQRLAARKRGDGKSDDIAARTARKEALLVEMLARFVEARRAAPEKVRKPATGKPAAGKPAARAEVAVPGAKKNASTGAGAKKARAAVAGTPAKGAEAGSSTAPPARKRAARKQSGTRATDKSSATTLSPESALENTRSLLEAKQERDRSAQAWQTLDPSGTHVPQPGYQSAQAAGKAQALHDAEARIPGIQGSSSARDRYNQGKRDHRGDTD